MSHISADLPAYGQTHWDVPLATAVSAIVAKVNTHDDALDGTDGTPISATYSTLAQLAASPDLLAVGAITRSGTGAATGFAVVWPDGAIGTFIGTESTTTPGAIDAYTITHVKAGTTITYTQPTLTRNASGAVTNRPAITAA